MPIDCKPESALEEACRLVGSQSALARLIGKAQSTVNERVRKGLPIWPEAVLAIEHATGIPRHVQRPDLYPYSEPPGAAGVPHYSGGTTLLEDVTR